MHELTRGPAAAPVFDTVAVVPARNEEDGLAEALWSLADQTTPPDLIVVVVNNSTDATRDIAERFAAATSPFTLVIDLPRNPHKKAGALNAGIAVLTRLTGRNLAASCRHLLVMDADTRLHPEFVARGRRVLASQPQLGGVSAACLGRPGAGGSLWRRALVGMQRIEYGRYAATRFRRNVHTMSGAGSFYRAAALQDLLDSRGQVFWADPRNLVEDYETTLALKEVGWRVTANQQLIAYTDLMPTVRMLLAQRGRWVRGTVDELRRRGVTRHTWTSIAALALGVAGIAYTVVWLSLSARATVAHGFTYDPRYGLLVAFWAAYQVLTVRHLGWRAVLVEAVVLPELAFTFLRNYWLVTSVARSYLSRASAWS
jgi:cellulose synthase/poly-beta-1,6-N-acetylglucosamine synthase-like glycosyltransferase